MKLGRKIILGSIFLVALFLVWYLFIKPYDYRIRFTKKTAPGTLFKTVESWAADKYSDLTLLKEKKIPFQKIDQDFRLKDSLLQFNWEFKSENDSMTTVIVAVNDKEHSLATRINSLYGTTLLKQIALSKITDFNEQLDSHLKRFNVDIVGESEIPTGYYAYYETSSLLSRKAESMMSKNLELMGWLKDNKIPVIGHPSLEVTSWNVEKDSISYNFMFPVERNDSLPSHELIKFKKTKPIKALKAIFHGNYRISDRAWFALLTYAEKKGKPIKKTPIEFFFNDPMSGGNELDWRAEIYMPLAE